MKEEEAMEQSSIANQTYVVTGVFDHVSNEYRETLYAGQNKEKAMDFTVDEHMHTLELDVWAEGILLQSYRKKDIYNWLLEFDKMQQLYDALQTKQEEVKQQEEEISKIKRTLGINE